MFRLMIVEDEPLLLRHIAEKVRAIDPDFRIVGEYENGEYAMMELPLLKPHVVLTDIYMPVMDGLQLIEQIRRTEPATICAVLTGFRDFEYARKAMQLGVTDYLLKPPENESIADFLAQAKSKLLRDQSLMQDEILELWAYRGDDAEGEKERLQRYANEYFYHTRYVVISCHVPSGTERAFQRFPHGGGLEELLEEGERLYIVPSKSNDRRIAIIGCHAMSERRLHCALERTASSIHAETACVEAAFAAKLQRELYGTLAALQRNAQRDFPLEGKVCSQEEADETGEKTPKEAFLPIPGSMEQDLGLLLSNQRKAEFLRKLELVLRSEAWGQGTRMQWQRELHFRLSQWMQRAPELAADAARFRWHAELQEIVWQANGKEALIQGLLEWFAAFFDASEPGEDATWIESSKAYLDTHYMENISLADLAERYGLNPSYFGRGFKRRYGVSPIDYVIRIRIENAKKLIESKPRMLLKDIAEVVGYSDPYYFSKLFKQWTGRTPREFKRSTMEGEG